VGFDSLFFLAGLAAHPWGLLRSMSPPVRTLGWGWGFYGSPTFGTTRDLVHVTTSVRSPICKCRAYSGPSPAARSRAAPPPAHGEDPSGTQESIMPCAGPFFPAAVRPTGRQKCRKAAPARQNVARFAVLRAPGRVPERCNAPLNI